MRILFLFLDGVGLGDDDPSTNPFAAADLPTLTRFTQGRRWLRDLPVIESRRAVFIPTDACLGVAGKPQSATGQATIMTGINVPMAIGRHYGPKPNPEIAEIVTRQSVVRVLAECGRSAALLNAYPSQYIASLGLGRRLPSSNQLALQVGGVGFRDGQALLDGRALSADFTGEMWRLHAARHDAASKVRRARPLHPDTPIITPEEAGRLLGRLAREQDFTFFDTWLTDYLGHRGTMAQAIRLLQAIDRVMAGLLEAWDDSEGLIVLTSDHGNLEALGERGHTRNPVPTLVIGDASHEFAHALTDLTGFAPAIRRMLCA